MKIKKTLDSFLGADNPFQRFYERFSNAADEALQSGLFIKQEDGDYRLSQKDLRDLILTIIAGRSVFESIESIGKLEKRIPS